MPGGWCCVCINRCCELSRIVSSRNENQPGFFPLGKCRSLGEICCHSSRYLLSAKLSCLRYKICLFQSCCLNILYLGLLERIDSSGVLLSWINWGHALSGLIVRLMSACCSSCIILNMVVCLLGPSMVGCGC